MFEIITSNANKTYKRIRLLHTKKGRSKHGEFIVEGAKFVEEALASCDVITVAVSQSYAKNQENMAAFPPCKVIVFADHLFEKMATTATSPGIMALCKKMSVNPDVLLADKPAKLYAILEDIREPGNLGAIIRVADAADADAVILSPTCAELYNPATLRCAAGSVFHLPIIEGADIKETVSLLKKRGVYIYAAHVGGGLHPYGLNLRESSAFLIGNEANGLTPETAHLADALVKLPMPGKAESLNASVAAGVLLYDAVRQRCVGAS